MALRPHPPTPSSRPTPAPAPQPDPPASRWASESPSSSWSFACGWVAGLLPLSLGLWHAADQSTWRGDGALLGLLGGPPDVQGAFSSWLGQLLQLLPVGSVISRAAILGAAALGVAGVLVFRLTLRLLQANGPAPRLNPLLSLCAAVTTSCCLPWLSEGTVLGGQALAGALALGALTVALDLPGGGTTFSPARIVLSSALITAAALESLWAAAPVGLALLVVLWQRGRLPRAKDAALFAGTATTLSAAALAPVVFAATSAPWQHLSPQRAAQLLGDSRLWSGGSGFLGDSGLVDGDLEGLTRPLLLPSWLDEVGLLVLVAAAVGAVWGLLQGSPRRILAPLGVLLAFDLLLPAAAPVELVPQGRVAAHLIALAAVTGAAALGLQTLAVLARHAGLLGARPATILLGVLTAAVTWAGVEDSLRLLARRNFRALDAWTDEALSSMPPRSLVVVSSAPLVRRLTAATASGARPDLVVVPLPLLGQGSLAAELLRLEPALGLLIRELSVSGRPGELALTALADVRPLFVEADPSWDRRLVAHLIPGPFLARFAPHALGRSDRRGALASQEDGFERVATLALGAGDPDPATLAVLRTSARHQIALLTLLGDKEEAQQVEQRLLRVVDPPGASAEAPRLAALDE